MRDNQPRRLRYRLFCFAPHNAHHRFAPVAAIRPGWIGFQPVEERSARSLSAESDDRAFPRNFSRES
jgi:hypothetical protein